MTTDELRGMARGYHFGGWLPQTLTWAADELDRLKAIVDKGLDYEHHSSCGHVWTMRHTACPECFAQRQALLRRIEGVLLTAARSEDIAEIQAIVAETREGR